MYDIDGRISELSVKDKADTNRKMKIKINGNSQYTDNKMVRRNV